MATGPATGFTFKPSRDWGDDWHGYFTEYNQQLSAYTNKSEEKADKTPTVLVMGHEVSGDDPVANQLHEWASLFIDNGYDYKVGYSKSFVPAFNVRSRDKVMEWSYIEAVKRGKPKVHVVFKREEGTKSWTNANSWVYGKGEMGLKQIQKEIERGK